MKLIFIPFSVGGGLLAGLVAKSLFNAVWGLVDKEEAPEPEHRYISLAKLTAALALEGAIFRLVRGLFDHGSRQGFLRLTGTWPGDELPEAKQ